jgi:Lrp/AsnC family leucine-responsive transcriptional regulator
MDDRIDRLLDRAGRKLLDLLQENARLSLSELGRLVHLSPPAVGERLRRMEEAGLICGYHARLDPDKLGLPIQAFLRLRTPAEKYPRVLAVASELPEVLECCHLTGDDAFVMRVAAASTADLENIIARLSPFGETPTALILSTPVKKELSVSGLKK